jgi:hypothetical protein
MRCTANAELPESKLEAQAPHRPSQIRQLKRKAARNSRFLSRWKSESRIVQPVRHRLQPLPLGGSAPKAPYRLAVPAQRYRYRVGFVADVNAWSMGMDHSKLRSSLWIFRIVSRRCLRFISFQWLRVEGLVVFWMFCGGLVFMLTFPR